MMLSVLNWVGNNHKVIYLCSMFLYDNFNYKTICLIGHEEPPRKTVQPQELMGIGLGQLIRNFSLG
jgi:hypothetical protein